MSSPFPGMDPWLESPHIFPDLHNSLIAALRDSINALLPAPFFAAIANRVWIEASERSVEPDFYVFKDRTANGAQAMAATAESLEVKPIIVRMPHEEITEWALEIHADSSGNRLVTSIEVLSLANKKRRGKGRRLYLKKQREMRRGHINLVEIDLLRGGMHTTIASLKLAIEEAGPFDYHVCVYRFDKNEGVEVYPIRLPQKLPKIAIPLLPEVGDVHVNLQEALTGCYDRGLYFRRIQYERPCLPPLTSEQQTWAEQLLRQDESNG